MPEGNKKSQRYSRRSMFEGDHQQHHFSTSSSSSTTSFSQPSSTASPIDHNSANTQRKNGLFGNWFPTDFLHNTQQQQQQQQRSDGSGSIPFSTDNAAADLMLNMGMERIYGGGKEFVNAGVGRYMTFFGGLKQYFNVDNQYVMRKLKLILFPYMHKSWDRRIHQSGGGSGGAGTGSVDVSDGFDLGKNGGIDLPGPRLPPTIRDSPSEDDLVGDRDINDPDLYIPAMAFVTYILLVGFVLGATDVNFTPEVLASTATKGLFISLFEILIIRGGFYMLDVPSDLSLLDITAYTTYKYVGIVLSIIAGMIFGAAGYYPVMVGTLAAMVYFVTKTLRRSGIHTSDHSMRVKLDIRHSKRNTFILAVVALQIPIFLFLSFPYAGQVAHMLFSASGGSASGEFITKPPLSDPADYDDI